MKYPALDIRGLDADLALALVDEFAPTAVEDLRDGISVFFATTERRDAAAAAVGGVGGVHLATREVDDEDWARRSQENLTAVTVGRLVVTPPWCMESSKGDEPTGNPPLRIVILPSMGFGTGHHATTRLCLAALQAVGARDKQVVDVGTGSGVLALAAAVLGARESLGIDVDVDAVQSARENLDLNPGITGVRFEVADLRERPLPRADIVLANLTGAVLVQNASLLLAATAPAGILIASGLQAHERDAVVAAFAAAEIVWSGEDAGWVGLALRAR